MLKFNAPPGTPSNVGASQLAPFYFEKKALVDARKLQFFSQLADVTSMPKNMGKTIKKYQYVPLLDDRNLNDMGLDAAGAVISNNDWVVSYPSMTTMSTIDASAAGAVAAINVGTGVNGNAAPVATAGAAGSAGTGRTLITLANAQRGKYTLAQKNTILGFNLGANAQQQGGNLYGSSKDIGLISGKLPVISETGGRVNRVGFKRIELQGSIAKFGFFDEYTKESMDFDSDADLQQHITREMVNGAMEITEDALQIDLLNSAGAIRFAGGATSNVTVGATVVTYSDLLKLAIDLDNNRTPKHTTVITGTRLIDTRVLPAARVMYIGSELLPTIKAMKDLHNNPAFISVEKYSAGGTTLNGEVGAIDQFRIIVVPEMLKWAGAGADASATATNYETNERYDVFPMLVIGDESFTTIGFQTDGKTVKFKITHKAPGDETADRNDPYGELGFMSIKWYYGFLALRPERIGLIKTSAAL
jgi:N4-gp56 family major capsid protein